jgi:hypothetical protein
MEAKSDLRELPDLRQLWPERLARVRASQARTDTSGMTRPPRDPDEREFLESRGQLGPFCESKRPQRKRRSG